jgi:hypothetical protein
MSSLSPHKRWVVKQMLYRDLLTELDGHFVAMGVDYMPIKGAYLILTGLAEQIDAREMLDVDILVDRENFDRVRDYFAACPSVITKDDPWPFEFGVYFSNSFHKPLLVEVHHQLNRPERFHLLTADLFSRAQQIGPFCWLPSLEDGLTIAVCHSLVHIGWGHFREDVFADFDVITGNPAFSWERFEPIMSTTGISRYWQFLCLLYEKRYGRKLYPRVSHSLWAGLALATYLKWYGKIPVPFMRALFELPFVRDAVGLIRAGHATLPTHFSQVSTRADHN